MQAGVDRRLVDAGIYSTYLRISFLDLVLSSLPGSPLPRISFWSHAWL